SPSSAGTSSITITCGFTARSDGSHQRISWLAAKVRSGQREIGASRPLAKLDESGALALEDRPQCVTPHIGCHVHAEPKHMDHIASGGRRRYEAGLEWERVRREKRIRERKMDRGESIVDSDEGSGIDNPSCTQLEFVNSLVADGVDRGDAV